MNASFIYRKAEIRLILCCSRVLLSQGARKRLQAILREEIDWSFVLDVALKHGVSSLLFRTLCGYGGQVPEAVLAELYKHYRISSAHNLFLTGELLRLNSLFDRHGIPLTSFKGPTLAISAYQDVTLRVFDDLDLLISRRDIIAARELLRADGYLPAYVLSQREERRRSRTELNCDLVHCEHKGVIELHSAFGPKWAGFHLDPEPLLARRHWINIGGNNVACFPHEEMLLILCAHGATHLWERLLWICDIAELIRSSPRLNWSAILETSERINGTRALFLGLSLARTILEADIPPHVLDAVEHNRTVSRLTSDVSSRLFDHTARLPSCLGSNFRRALRFVKLRERLQDKMLHVLHLIHLALAPTPDDRASILLPASLDAVYYIVRPFRIFIRHLRRLLNPGN